MMMMSSEKKGGNDFWVEDTEILRQAVRECNFEILGYIRHEFTWTNNGGCEYNIQALRVGFFRVDDGEIQIYRDLCAEYYEMCLISFF